MKRIINGKTYDIPEAEDGTIDVETLRDYFDLDRGTTLLEVSPDHQNQILRLTMGDHPRALYPVIFILLIVDQRHAAEHVVRHQQAHQCGDEATPTRPPCGLE